MKIYLAGKIEQHDWRGDIVENVNIDYDPYRDTYGDQNWRDSPFKGDLRGHVCTGPFFISGCHYTNHGPSTHGVGANDNGCCNRMESSVSVVAYCLDAIRRSDVVFAWLGKGAWDAYGTIYEMGYAKAMGVPVWVAGTESNRDQWFVAASSDRSLWGANSPVDALTWFVEHSSRLPQSCDIHLRSASADPEVIKARKIFTEFGPAGQRVPIPRHIRAAVWEKTGGTCWYCKQPTNPYDDFQVDHVMPVSKGGANRIDNLVPCCQPCNAQKRNHVLVDR